MHKNIKFTLLAVATFVAVNATYEDSHHAYGDDDPQILMIKQDAERIAQASLISAMTIPDKIEQNWDGFENALKEEVNKRIEINSDKLKYTFARYKKVMEQAIVQGEIRDLAWNSSSIVSEKVPTPCNMACVKYCFTDTSYRFENVEDIYEVCLVPECNCTTGDISYSVQKEKSG